MANPEAVDRPLSDEEVFGPAGDREVGLAPSVDLSPLERAFEEIAEGARSSSLKAAKATIEEAVDRFEKITDAIKEKNAEIVTKAVESALEKISAGTRMDTSTIREIVGNITSPDLSVLDTLREEIVRVGKLVEGVHGAIASTVRAAREEIIEAVKTELKVEVKAPEPAPKKPTEWQFDIEYDREDPEKPARVIARPRDTTPRTALEAARRAA